MDLNRLTIPDAGTPAAPPRRWPGLLAGAAGLAVGALAYHLVCTLPSAGRPRVRTAVVRSPSASTGKGFTAGGWIEARAPYEPVQVSARLSERLEELRFHEGQDVPPGAVVARLYDGDAKERLAVAEARLASARAHHALMRAGPRAEEIQAAEARLAEAEERVRLARANAARSRALQPGAIAPEQLDAEVSAQKQAEAARDRAAAERDRLKTGYRAEEVAMAAAAEEEAGAAVELARRQLDYCTLRAPDAGKPLRVLRVHLPVGTWIHAEKGETAVLSLYDPGAMQVRVDVTQPHIRHVTVGGKAEIVTEANPERRYAGTVLRAEPLAVLAKNTVTVRVRIDDPDDLLFPDMVAQVTFHRADAADAPARGLFVPAEALLDPAGPSEAGGRNGVWVVVDGRLARSPVVVKGIRNGQAEVVEGLTSGQRVVVGGGPALREGQAVEEVE